MKANLKILLHILLFAQKKWVITSSWKKRWIHFFILPLIFITIQFKSAAQSYRADTAAANNIIKEIHKGFYSDISRTKILLVKLEKQLRKQDYPVGNSAYFNFLAGMYWFNGQLDSALVYYHKSLSEATRSKDKHRIMVANGNLGMIFNNIEKPDSSIKYLYEALSLSIVLNNKKSIGKNSLDISNYYLDLFDYNNALKFNKIADSLSILTNDTMLRMYANLNYGVIYANIRQYDLSLQHYMQAVKLQEINKKIFILPQIYMNIGLFYMELRNLDSAKYYFDQSLEITDSFNQKMMFNNILINYGAFYFELGDYSKSKQYLNRITSDAPFKVLSGKHINLSKIFLEEKKYDLAYFHVRKGIKYASEINHKSFWINGLFAKSRIDSALGNYIDAMEAIKLAFELKDQIWSEKLSSKVASITSESRYNSLLEENRGLAQTNLANQKVIERQRTINILLIILALLFSFFLLVYFLFSSRLKRANQTLNQNQEMLKLTNSKLEEANKTLDSQNNMKTNLISIISHDIKAPLGSVSQLLHLINQSLDQISNDEKKRLIESVLKSINNSYNTLENLLSWTGLRLAEKGSDFSSINILNLIKFNLDLLNSSASSKQITFHVNCQNDLIIFHSENFISTILRNYISNSIKYCLKNGNIWIDVSITQGSYKISVIDDGVGIDDKNASNLFSSDAMLTTLGTQKEKGNGFGLKLVKELAEFYGVQVGFNSVLNSRTEFYVVFAGI